MYRKLLRPFTMLAVLAMVFLLTISVTIQTTAAEGGKGNPESGSHNGVHTVQFNQPAVANPDGCTSGAHTLSKFGDRVYPEMGNGG